jgi:hypothetical protein
MAHYNFGSGDLILIPIIANATPTPIFCQSLQDFELDFKFDEKDLHGSKQFPIANARGKGSIEGKFKEPSFNGALFNETFFGDTPATGQLLLATKEAGTVGEGTTGAYTITVDHAADFDTDCGVLYADTGKALKKVAESPSAGEYAVAAGEYTFAEADDDKDVLITYAYTSTTGGTVTEWTNKAMGAAPKFKAIYSSVYEDNHLTIQLNVCKSNDLKLAPSNEDFTVPEISFKAFADASDKIGKISLVE